MDFNVFSLQTKSLLNLYLELGHIFERMDFEEVWKMVFGKPQHAVESCMVWCLRWG